jgi:exosortase/archaeosortase family protein
MTTASAQRLSVRTRPATLGRRRLFAFTIAILVANAVATRVIDAVVQLGPVNALASGLGLSWAFWLSFALCMRLALIEEDRPAPARELWICGAGVAAALIPISPVSSLACTALAGFILLDRTMGVHLKAAAMVALAISIQLLWSRLLMLFFVGPVADLDAHLVGLIMQTPVHGNMVGFADGSHRLSILEACTSVQNASVALMLFVAIVRTFRPQPRVSELYFLLGLFVSVVVVNIIRLTLMAQNIEMFHLVHGDIGWPVINAIITVIGLLWAVLSVRREVFD